MIDFFTASDSPVKEDCPTYKSLESIILKSAGIILPADNKTVSNIVISLIGTCLLIFRQLYLIYILQKNLKMYLQLPILL